MNLRFHTDPSVFYDQGGYLYPEPKETLEELEAKFNDACDKLKALPKPKPACEYSDDDADDLFRRCADGLENAELPFTFFRGNFKCRINDEAHCHGKEHDKDIEKCEDLCDVVPCFESDEVILQK